MVQQDILLRKKILIHQSQKQHSGRWRMTQQMLIPKHRWKGVKTYWKQQRRKTVYDEPIE